MKKADVSLRVFRLLVAVLFFSPRLVFPQDPAMLRSPAVVPAPTVSAEADQPEKPASPAVPSDSSAVFADASPLSVVDSAAQGLAGADVIHSAAPAATVIPADAKIMKSGYNLAPEKNYLPGYGTITSDDAYGFSYRYDLGASKTSALDVVIEAAQKPIDLTNGLHLRISRSGSPSGYGLQYVQVLIEDANHQMTSYRAAVSEGDGSVPEPTVNLDIHNSAVTKITFRQTFSDLRLMPDGAGRRGEIHISLVREAAPAYVNGTAYQPEFFTAPPPSIVPYSYGSLSGIGTVPGFISKVMQEGNTSSFRYDIGGSAGSLVTAGFLSIDGHFGLPGPVSFAARNNGNGARLRVRLTSEGGKTAVFILNTTSDWQTFTLDPANPAVAVPGFDPARITSVDFEVDRTLSPERRGSFDIQFPKSLTAVPVLTGDYHIADSALRLDVPAIAQEGTYATLEGSDNGWMVYDYDVKSRRGPATVTLFSLGQHTGIQVPMSAPAKYSLTIQLSRIDDPVQYPVPVRIRFKDMQGHVINVDLLLVEYMNAYEFDFTALDPAFDYSHIESIAFEHSADYSRSAPRARMQITYSTVAADEAKAGPLITAEGLSLKVKKGDGFETVTVPVPPGADPEGFKVFSLKLMEGPDLDGNFAKLTLNNGEYRLVDLDTLKIISVPHNLRYWWGPQVPHYSDNGPPRYPVSAYLVKRVEEDNAFYSIYESSFNSETFIHVWNGFTNETATYDETWGSPQFWPVFDKPWLVSHDGSETLVPGEIGAVYLLHLDPISLDVIPLPGYSRLARAEWISDTRARIVLENGKNYLFDAGTLQLTEDPETGH